MILITCPTPSVALDHTFLITLYIECTFGILANKWRILHKPLNVNMTLPKKL